MTIPTFEIFCNRSLSSSKISEYRTCSCEGGRLINNLSIEELNPLHDFLFFLHDSQEDIKELCQESPFKRELIDLNFQYFKDFYREQSLFTSQGQRENLIRRCHSAFDKLIKKKSNYSKPAIIEKIDESYRRVLNLFPLNRIHIFHLGIVKPLCESIRYQPLIKLYQNTLPIIKKFWKAQNCVYLMLYIRNLLLPCVRSKKTMTNIGESLTIPLNAKVSLQKQKESFRVSLRPYFDEKDQNILASIAFTMTAILQNEPEQPNDDPPPNMNQHLQLNQYSRYFLKDPEMLTVFMNYVAVPLAKSKWRRQMINHIIQSNYQETESSQMILQVITGNVVDEL